MAYRIFISHSTRDKGLVIALANLLAKSGIEVSVAEWYIRAGESLSEKVERQIAQSDSVVVFLTRDGLRSKWVQQEVGIAIGKGKLVIPLVEKGTPTEELAALQGKEFIEYDPTQPESSLDRAARYVRSLKAGKEERERTLLVVGCIIAFLLFLYLTDSSK